MDGNWLRRLKNTKIEIWQYIVDWWDSIGKENLIGERKVQNQMFMDSIKFY
jgi:hypothetical protein